MLCVQKDKGNFAEMDIDPSILKRTTGVVIDITP